MTRTETITALLERYDDLVDPQQAGHSANLTGVPLMPPTYTDSVRELERLLRRMRDDRSEPLLRVGERKVSVRACWWHINTRYIACTRVIKVEMVRRRGKHGKHITVPERHVITLANGSEDAIVKRGVQWIADAWSLKHEPMLPDEAKVAA
jgi:hypothetical protein